MRKYSLDGPKLYGLQEDYIEHRFGEEAAKSANYGWFVDDIQGTIQTKVYGHGVLITNAYGQHTFEEW